MRSYLPFFEIPAADFERAVSFYESLFRQKMPACVCETEKMAFFMDGDDLAGALSWDGDFKPSVNGVLIYFRCEAIEPLLAEVVRLGGSVARPKTKIEAEGQGYFALFHDSEGNRIGLYADR